MNPPVYKSVFAIQILCPENRHQRITLLDDHL